MEDHIASKALGGCICVDAVKTEGHFTPSETVNEATVKYPPPIPSSFFALIVYLIV